MCFSCYNCMYNFPITFRYLHLYCTTIKNLLFVHDTNVMYIYIYIKSKYIVLLDDFGYMYLVFFKVKIKYNNLFVVINLVYSDS